MAVEATSIKAALPVNVGLFYYQLKGWTPFSDITNGSVHPDVDR